MDFFIKNDRLKSGLQLFRTEQFVGIANIDILDDSATIKEYKKWKNGVIGNALPLSDKKWCLQQIYISYIKEIESIDTIKKDALYDVNKWIGVPLKEKDVLVPFLGGVKGSDFSFLVNRLWKIEGNYWDYRSEIKKYYTQLFKLIYRKNEF